MTGTALPSQPVFWTLANVFTFARFGLAPVCAVMFLQESHWGWWVGGWMAGLAMFTDVCDGYFARRQKNVSDLGKIFDPLADAVFFIVVWTAMALAGAFPIWLVLPFILRETLQHVYIRPMAMRHGVALAANIWGKLKTLTQTLVLVTICWLEFLSFYFADMALWARPTNLVMVAATGLISLLSILPYFRTLRVAGTRLN
jgi:CDP-diacylglycerol---glycerol-3-phosphate 3-phosphatidyltransferase